MRTQPILAIDFGTTNSLAGVWTPEEKIAALPLDPTAHDPTLFRSLLYFPHPEACFYGAEAISQYLDNEMEGRLFRSFKAHLPNRGYLGTVVGNRMMPLENMVGLFLLEIKKRSEKILSQPVTSVLLGRPARYSMDPVQDGFAMSRMIKAARYAGFQEIHFLPEPLGAAFELRSRLFEQKLVLIGDFGGGTSDFTILKISDKPFEKSDVLAIEGCPLAGDALDAVFMKEKLSAHFGAKSRYRLPLGSNVLTMPPSVSERLQAPAHIVHLKDKETFEFIRTVRQCALGKQDQESVERLLALVEEQLIFSFFESIEGAKRGLSIEEKVEFVFDEPGVIVKETLSKKDFESWAVPVRDQIFSALDRALENACLTSSEIDLVCLTGGTAKVPLVREALRSRFGDEKLQSSESFHSVQKGLVEAAEMWGKSGVPPAF